MRYSIIDRASLQQAFADNPSPSRADLAKLANKENLTFQQVRDYFRRHRMKRGLTGPEFPDETQTFHQRIASSRSKSRNPAPTNHREKPKQFSFKFAPPSQALETIYTPAQPASVADSHKMLADDANNHVLISSSETHRKHDVGPNLSESDVNPTLSQNCSNHMEMSQSLWTTHPEACALLNIKHSPTKLFDRTRDDFALLYAASNDFEEDDDSAVVGLSPSSKRIISKGIASDGDVLEQCTVSSSLFASQCLPAGLPARKHPNALSDLTSSHSSRSNPSAFLTKPVSQRFSHQAALYTKLTDQTDSNIGMYPSSEVRTMNTPLTNATECRKPLHLPRPEIPHETQFRTVQYSGLPVPFFDNCDLTIQAPQQSSYILVPTYAFAAMMQSNEHIFRHPFFPEQIQGNERLLGHAQTHPVPWSESTNFPAVLHSADNNNFLKPTQDCHQVMNSYNDISPSLLHLPLPTARTSAPQLDPATLLDRYLFQQN